MSKRTSTRKTSTDQSTPATADTPVTSVTQNIDSQTAPVDARQAQIEALQKQLADLSGTGSVVVSLAPAMPSGIVPGTTGAASQGILAPSTPPASPANVPDRTPKTEASASTEPNKPAMTPAQEKEARDRASAAIKAAGTFGDRLSRAMATIETFSKVASLETTVAGLKVETAKLASFVKLAPKLAKVNVKLAESDRDTYAGVLSQLTAIEDYQTRLNDAGRKAAAVAFADLLKAPSSPVMGPADLNAGAEATGHRWQVGDSFTWRVAEIGDNGPTFERIVSLAILGKVQSNAGQSRTSHAVTVQPAANTPTTSTPATSNRGAQNVPHPMQPGAFLSNTEALRLAAEAGDRRSQECIAKLDAGQNANRTFSVSKEAPAAFKRLGWAHPANAS